jgi:hypothetical protein
MFFGAIGPVLAQDCICEEITSKKGNYQPFKHTIH